MAAKSLASLVMAVLLCAVPAAAHVTEIIIGRTSAGRLKVDIEGHLPVQLNTSLFPGTVGWAEAEPGFETLQTDRPVEDFFVPASASDLAFTLVSIDPGILVLNDTGSGPMLPGETYHLGSPFFDVHPFFNIHGGVPGQVHRLRIIVRDLNNIYTPSEEIEVTFVSSPCYANCDASALEPHLTANDFLCFLNKFAAGDPYANCDASLGSPALTANDFQCFLNQFAAGCS